MKVKHLIQNTVWLPGSSYGIDAPVVSVLLPTFRRAKSGLFRKAVESVLNQSMGELELIIIDDASTDGTAEQIAEFMARDGRVSCLKHKENIGLPAVSEFEGFQRARGEYVAFQFDDDQFNLDALEKMVTAAKALNAKFVYGHVDFVAIDPQTGEEFTIKAFGRGQQPQTTLQTTNYISNNAVLLHRSLVETIGFYDPNIAITRLCDYDLWRRCAQHYTLHNIDISVGTITGPATDDSLGHTYAMERWLSYEWMGLERTEQLLPKNFGELDVLAIPIVLTTPSQQAAAEIRYLFSGRPWYARAAPTIDPFKNTSGIPEGLILIVVLSHTASVTLNFEGLPPQIQQRVRIVNGNLMQAQIQEELVGASAVIFVRALFEFSFWIEHARRLKVPHYFYLDDNLCELAKLPDHKAQYASYTIENMREMLKSFEGAFFSTPTLAAYFQKLKLHHSLLVLPPSLIPIALYDDVLFDTALLGELTIVFCGGNHRIGLLETIVFPAIVALSAEHPVRLITVGLDARVAEKLRENAKLRLFTFEASDDYRLVIGRLKQTTVDIIVHPAELHPNNQYKTLNVLINAVQLGAVPVLSNCEPYCNLKHGDVAYLVDDTVDAWKSQLRDIAEDDGRRAALLARLDEFVKTNYSVAAPARLIESLLSKHGMVGWVKRSTRFQEALQREKEHSFRLESAIRDLRSVGAAAPNFFGAIGASSIAKGAETLDQSIVSPSRLTKIFNFMQERFALDALEIGKIISLRGTTNLTRPYAVCRTNLGARPYREYPLPITKTSLKEIVIPLALDVHALAHAAIGVEIVSANNEITFNHKLSLRDSFDGAVVVFALPSLIVSESGWRLRIFVRDTVRAVYLYERRSTHYIARFLGEPMPLFDLVCVPNG